MIYRHWSRTGESEKKQLMNKEKSTNSEGKKNLLKAKEERIIDGSILA